MPFVTPRTGTSSASSAPGGRTTFRPPWVKDDGGSSATTSSTKPTTTPWAKKNAEATTATKENGEKSTTATKPKATSVAKKATTTTAEPTKKVTEPVKKVAEPAKKAPEPAKKVVEPVKKSSLAAKKTPEPVSTKKAPEPVKKVTPTAVTKKPVGTTSALKKKKEPTPPPESSSEEEESEEEEEEETEEETASEEEEEETEEESESEEEESEEEDTTIDEKVPEHVRKAAQLRPTTVNKKPEPESELSQRFTMEKPKLRSVVVKRDRSLKKMATEDDEEAEEGETEEDRERRRRFKLEKPKLRHVKREEKPLPSKSTDDLAKIRPVLKKVPKIDELLKEPKEEPKPEFTTKTLRKASLKREASIKNVPAPPPLPSLVPKAPPPPPPPLAPGEKRELTSTQKETLEKLRTRPRRRPDWSEMMKEVESGRKLRHVACNDRSQPILTCKSMTKVDDKFIYETEKDNSHNKLLKQIQGGIKLKPTRTNDRSKPVLDGLRKFRRQMTIEEQLQKSQSKINMLSEAPSSHALGPGSNTALGAGGSRPSIVSAMSIDEESPDELDDIDKIRDDLQSTKQMLALELRNREAQERENKKLLAKIRTLETELEREKSREKNLEYGSNVIVATMDPTPTAEQTFVNSLKREVEDARKVSKEVEQNYKSTSEQLVEAKTEVEEQRRQIQLLERKLAAALKATPSTNRPHISNCFAYDDDDDYDDDCFHYDHYRSARHQGGGSMDGSRRPSDANFGRDSSPELELEVSESDPDEPEEKKTERRERRSGKELKVLRSKLTKLKVKEEAAKKEKDALKQAMKKNHVILKEENKKFKKLEKEVQKMAASMKLDEDDVDGEEKDEDEEEPEEKDESEEEEEESDDESEESESEASEAETGSESEPEDSPNSVKKANVEPRVKKHESRFAAMKKCNVLLQANVDNLQDQIVQVRSRATNLQDELDAVIADLGF
ncbi:pinin isoform X1 [Drosophila serrata]|uniref:pinin isoform X1 n=2 Tax=Drosophila serrata TaxID=7274 RepID=UPI000A1D2445|nr:pinin isoform X1 [Drosophila serrata]XP_020811337.1 pinin isoform X1 [Drosophila serrata]XP_020811338.1 pinin isoform X1 [Drosophila serrata]